jgi:hypothetical protein
LTEVVPEGLQNGPSHVPGDSRVPGEDDLSAGGLLVELADADDLVDLRPRQRQHQPLHEKPL